MKLLLAAAVAACFLLVPASALAATPECYGFDEGETLDYELTEFSTIGACYDEDGDTITIEVTQEPTKGDAATEPSNEGFPAFISYTPDTIGEDTIEFKASDGTNTSNEVTVTTNNIAFTDDPPDCYGSELPDPDQYEVGEQTGLGACYDDEFQNLHITITQNGTHGTATVIDQDTPDASVAYTATDSTGDDTIKFKAHDGTSDSAVFTATTQNVPFVDDAPYCYAAGGTFEIGVASLAGECYDDEADPLHITITQSPTRGAASVAGQDTPGATVQYTASVPGADVFKFKASDGNSDSTEETVTTNNVGASGNHPPVCSSGAFNLEIGAGHDYSCTDPDGDALSYATVSAPTKGSVRGLNGPSRLRYTATAPGMDTFQVGVTDGRGGSTTATVTSFNTARTPKFGGGSSAGSATPNSKGVVTLKTTVDCSGGGPDCKVTAAAAAKVAGAAAVAAKKKKKAKTVKLGKSSFVVKSGAKGKVRVKLSKKGLKLLKKLRKIKATVTVRITRGNQTVTKKIKVTFKAPKAKKKR